MTPDLVDLAPIAQLLFVGALLATLALVPLWWRHRRAPAATRLRSIVAITMFLTFDLVLFGAFTRLTDSGLGCPDWPGCYGNASPVGAQVEISQAQAERPTGPVTHGKAWIEMIHRYLATAVGALITLTMVWSALAARRRSADPHGAPPVSPAWAALCLVWVCAQGAFGALTVTMKLYPAIVTAHLLGGIGLLALLAVQVQRLEGPPVAVAAPVRVALGAVLLLVIAQVTLGGWVSTNYAVLACTDFPTCQGSWWPDGDYAQAFTLRRELGHTADGAYLSFDGLVAIHWVHRVAAMAVFLAIAGLAVRLWSHPVPTVRRCARISAALALWQFATGLGNVVLGWPLVAAVAHTGGAAVLVALLAGALARTTSRPPASPGKA